MHSKSTRRGIEYSTLGAAVRETRARRGMSQEALGFASGIHRNYIGALERGEVNPTFRTITALCGGLRVPLSELFGLYESRLAEGARSADA